MFLVHCHLDFSALTQTVVGEDGRDLYTFYNLDEDCCCQWEGDAAAQPAVCHQPRG